MIIKNVFLTEIQLEIGSYYEFVDKGWYALNMHNEFPDEKIGGNAFLDWARDLTWIEQDHIIVIVKGKIQDETREIIEFLNREWEKQLKNDKKPCYQKRVDFIIVG